MTQPTPRPATYADLEALPPGVTGHIVDGELVVTPQATVPHQGVVSVLGAELSYPLRRGRGGSGGWIILVEPELRLGRNVVVPDLCGYRREELAEIPDAPFLTQRPSWICEVLSPSTERFDRGRKRALYAMAGVPWLWFISPTTRLLEVNELRGDVYAHLASFEDDEKARAQPFEAIELDLALLWSP